MAYDYLGSGASVTGLENQIPWATWFRVASGLLFLYVVVTYLIKTGVLARFALLTLVPAEAFFMSNLTFPPLFSLTPDAPQERRR